LTAAQVLQRFGVKPVTYYSWRKASKKGGARARAIAPVGASSLDIAGQIRQAVRAQIARLLPEVVRSEVTAALGGLGARRGRRKKR
jgi:hypothetical protein